MAVSISLLTHACYAFSLYRKVFARIKNMPGSLKKNGYCKLCNTTSIDIWPQIQMFEILKFDLKYVCTCLYSLNRADLVLLRKATLANLSIFNDM